MAKKPEVNRSQAIRDYLKEHPEAGPKAVADGLKSRGITVTEALVSNVKYGSKPSDASKKKVAPAKEKEPVVNKTQEVKNILLGKPDASPTEVAEALAKQGIQVAPGYVSGIKSDMKKKVPPKKKAPSPVAASANDTISVSTLVQAKKMADQLGGVGKLKEAIDALAKLQ